MSKPKILIPMHSQWCEKIFNREKKIDVRKTAPKIDTPFEALVYCTKSKPYLYRNPNNGELFLDNSNSYRGGNYEDRYLTGKVIGSFICNKVDLIEYKGNCYMINDDVAYTNAIASKSCLDYDDMYKYLGEKNGYSLHISDPKIYDKPRELWEYRTICKHMAGDKACYDCPYLVTNDDELNGTDFYGGKYASCDVYYSKPITRAPQSWMYIK